MARAKAAVVREELAAARKRWGWSPSDIVNLLRGGGNSSKGSAYERDTCRLLSRWWTGEARDDVFWRSAGSGARAKVRGRSGRDTAGQHGDIAATDPIGAALISVFTIELKRGYSDSTIFDLLDRAPTAGEQGWEGFLAQTIESADQAGSRTWLLIARRDRRQPTAWMPSSALAALRGVGAFAKGLPNPLARLRVSLRHLGEGPQRVDVCGMALGAWLDGIRPKHVHRLEATR